MGPSLQRGVSTGRDFLLFFFFLSLFVPGCGGGHSVRSALNGEPEIYVMTGKKEVALYVTDLAGGEIVGRDELPEKFSEIESTVANVLKQGVQGARVRTSAEFTPPQMKSRPYLEEVELPDWKKTDIDVVVFLDISFVYEAVPSDGGIPPYGYKLKGSVTLTMGETKRNGEMSPITAEAVVLANLEKSLSIKTRGIRALKELVKVLPPTTLLDELNAKAQDEMKQFLIKRGV